LEWSFPVPLPVALSAFAVLGYLFGRQQRQAEPTSDSQARRDMKRAQSVAKELEKIAEAVRKNLATHSTSIARFKERVFELSNQKQEAAWKQLCGEAEEMLKPTLFLASQIAHAYDEIRQQSNNLMAFAEVRTDPLTGVTNRRGLNDTLESMFAMLNRYETPFSSIILDIDNFKQLNDERGHLFGDQVLKGVASRLNENVRETDTVSRYGGEEFVIVMPHTDLEGATILGERLRRVVADDLTITLSGGVTEAQEGDTEQTMLARADAALYSAKAAGRNQIFVHDGADIEPVSDEVLAKV
jgi:diguanylate cyclase (GGDEF)-like protein